MLPVVPATANVLAEQAPVTLSKPYGGSSEIAESTVINESPEAITPEAVFAEEFKRESDVFAETNDLAGPETVFDDAVMTTFEQLAEFAAAENGEAASDTPESYEPFAEGQVILLNQETDSPAETSAFEAFIMTQPSPEIALNLETIIAAAPEQSLAETFVQLGRYLAEAPKHPHNSAIEDALDEVMELLPHNSVQSTTEALEAKMTITPELTQKLFTLLQAVGYPEPREALLAFVGDHDLAFLVQAIRYLHQLCNADSQQEFLPQGLAAASLPNASEPFAERLSRTIGRLITARLDAPGIAATN